ncbi:prepilin peptidase [Filifactor villosus]|uniref:Prepilin peptidase n=1 Tax=Filifactor villosus TaxID=29374 RepID=A0ABV9QLL8_9FIRM
MNYVSFGVTLTTLLICTMTDLKGRLIYNKVLLPYAVLGLVFSLQNRRSVYIVLSVVLFLLFLFLKELGEGDRKLLSILPMYLHEDTALFFFVLSLIYLLLYGYQKKKGIKTVAFAPYILLSYLISMALSVVKELSIPLF